MKIYIRLFIAVRETSPEEAGYHQAEPMKERALAISALLFDKDMRIETR